MNTTNAGEPGAVERLRAVPCACACADEADERRARAVFPSQLLRAAEHPVEEALLLRQSLGLEPWTSAEREVWKLRTRRCERTIDVGGVCQIELWVNIIFELVWYRRTRRM